MSRKRHWKLAFALVLIGIVALAWLGYEPAPIAPGVWMRVASVEPRFLDVAGMRIRYVRRGQGPAVVLIHGTTSSIYTWAEVIPALAQHHDVVAFDLPGFGGSEIRQGLSGADLVRISLGVMDGLGLDKASVVGNSLGGGVAAAMAAKAPERVERLVLIDAVGFNLSDQDRPHLFRMIARLPPTLGEHLPRRQLMLLGLRQVFHDPAHITEERVAEYLAPMHRPGAVQALNSLLNSPDTFGFPDLLDRIRAPTLVIWGREDRWIPVSDADRFVARIPQAEKAVVASCGHMPQEEAPQEIVRLLREFLRDLAGPTGSPS